MRDKIQEDIVTLIFNNRVTILELATGVGKSACAIKAINAIQNYSSKKFIKVLLVVAEIAHIDNWKSEFDKWNLDKNINITIECYASLKNYKNTKWDVCIFDEFHHLQSDIRLDIFSTITFARMIGLSATIPNSLYEYLNINIKNYAKYVITLQDAIDKGILPKPNIYLIPLTLENDNDNNIIIESWGKDKLKKKITCSYNDRWKYLTNRTKYPNLELRITCTQLQNYNYLCEQFEYWKRRYLNTRNEAIKVKWLQIGSKRKRFLGDCKTKYVRAFLSKICHKRYICFCSSIDQADDLGGWNNTIHSKNKESRGIINKFNTRQEKYLFAVNMAQEGLNLVDIEAGIIVQLDGYDRGWIQKTGRILRAEDPIQFIFYYKNTKDEEYLNKVLESMNNEYITTIENLDKFEI